jgi:hypothetical protein
MLMKRPARKPAAATQPRVCWTCVWTMSAGLSWPIWASLPGGWPQLRRCQSCAPA